MNTEIPAPKEEEAINPQSIPKADGDETNVDTTGNLVGPPPSYERVIMMISYAPRSSSPHVFTDTAVFGV